MSAIAEEPLAQNDEKLLENLQPALDQLTPAGKRHLLSRLARDCQKVADLDMRVLDDGGEVIAYLRSARPRTMDLSAMFTKEELANIERNLTDPKYLMSWQEMLAELDAEDQETGRSETIQPVAGR